MNRYSPWRRKLRRFKNRLLGDSGSWPVQRLDIRWKRGKYGVTKSDAWNLDSYLLLVMERGLRELAKMNHGYPETTADGREWTFEGWNAHLEGLADKIKKGSTLVDDYYETEDWRIGGAEKANELHQEADRLIKEALTEMIVIWDHLWD